MMTGIISDVAAAPWNGAIRAVDLDTITDAYDRARQSHQGFNYQDRLVIRNLLAPARQQEIWSTPYEEGGYGEAHQAMIKEIHRICIMAAIQAHEALQKAAA